MSRRRGTDFPPKGCSLALLNMLTALVVFALFLMTSVT